MILPLRLNVGPTWYVSGLVFSKKRRHNHGKRNLGQGKNILGLEIEDDLDEEFDDEGYAVEEETETTSGYGKKAKQAKPTVPVRSGSKVLVVEPEFFNDAPVICDNLKSNKTVVVNLENADYEDGRKIFDFLNGAVYALDGTIQKIGENVFILAPSTVDVIAENLVTDHSREFLDWNNEK
ncbi:cell division protein SepF [Alkalibacter rhizosphaerae]|uniref:Cell division protein SepF n=1 Tax=Alkalibacter rhizosphaerae TaxID=2815577 RepID=A0A974XMS6_9FIRM|nr:cell division protein SepF [Alkalibacter rhizosphaerae]QSX08761.1 cell division protein SepF [Alkalibacter rhizosphaerae]